MQSIRTDFSMNALDAGRFLTLASDLEAASREDMEKAEACDLPAMHDWYIGRAEGMGFAADEIRRAVW